MIPTGNHLWVRRFPYEQHGLMQLTEKSKFDFILSRPQVYQVLAKGPGRDPKTRALLAEISVGDRVLCWSDTEGPVEAGLQDEFMVTVGQVLAVFPKVLPPEPCGESL